MHLFGTIRKSYYLPEELKKIVYQVLQTNLLFAYPESILLAILADNRKHIQELGLQWILKCIAFNDN